jgi:hypothetical protein
MTDRNFVFHTLTGIFHPLLIKQGLIPLVSSVQELFSSLCSWGKKISRLIAIFIYFIHLQECLILCSLNGT